MNDDKTYAVFLFPHALEALGDPIRPHLREAPGGAHIVCATVDASGPLFQMTIDGRGPAGESLELEIMLPVSMVRLVMSMHAGHEIGFV